MLNPASLSDSARESLERRGITVPGHALLDVAVRQECRLEDVFRHYVAHFCQDAVRILDVGGCPMELDAYHDFLRRRELGKRLPREYVLLEDRSEEDCSRSFAGAIAQGDLRVCAVDVRTPYPSTQWGSATFLRGDFRDSSVRKETLRILGGTPDIVTGSMTFVTNVDTYLRDFGVLCAQDANLGNELASAAYDMLRPGGSLLAANGINENGSDELLPPFLRGLPMSLLYGNLGVRVYRKR